MTFLVLSYAPPELAPPLPSSPVGQLPPIEGRAPCRGVRIPHHEPRFLVEQSVKGAEERIASHEELIPPAQDDIAREDHRIRRRGGGPCSSCCQ